MTHQRIVIGLFVCTFLGLGTLRADDTPASQPAKLSDDQIKAALPDALGPLKLQPDKTEIVPDVVGMGVHGVTGKYAATTGQPSSGSINIMDFGPDAPASPMNMAEMAAGLKVAPQSTAESKRQRITVGGYPAIEQIDNHGTAGVVTLVVGKRFLVRIDASPMDEQAFRKLIEGVSFKKIEALGQ